jgi:signal transduction histidine kinase
VQDLYGLTYQLKVFTNDLPPEVDAAPTVEVHRMLSEVVRTLRTICRELRPPTLAPFGLERAIRSHADVFMEEHPEYDVYLDLTPDGQQLTEAVRLAFFRIYQQALQNILRHAEARQVWVTFRLDEESIFLAVRDDGHGFAVPDRWLDLARQGRIGLVGAAERAQAVGGKLEIHSTPGEGTVVQVHAPRRAKTTLEYFGLGGS